MSAAHRRAREEGIRPDDIPTTAPRNRHACDDPSCWACFLLPEAQARLVAEIRGAA